VRGKHEVGFSAVAGTRTLKTRVRAMAGGLRPSSQRARASAKHWRRRALAMQSVSVDLAFE
jgi:hypothetical protein